MYYDGEVHIEDDDLCYSCEYFVKGVNCPLLEALALGVVNLSTEIVVNSCGFYREFKRTLKLVGDDEDEGFEMEIKMDIHADEVDEPPPPIKFPFPVKPPADPPTEDSASY